MAETLDNLDDALFSDFEDYLAGTLPEARRREVAARLAASPEAQALLAEFTEAQTLFRNPVWDVPEPVELPSAQAILDRAKSRPTARKSFLAGMKEWFGVATWRPALASGFALALLASGTWLALRSNQKTEPVATGPKNTQKFFKDRPTIADPASNAQPGLTADSQTPKSPAQTGTTSPTSTPTRLDDLSKAGKSNVPENSPQEPPKPGDPAKITNEKVVPTTEDGIATGRADADKSTTDTKPAPELAKPATKATATGMPGGVPPVQPSPPPPPGAQPPPVVKTPIEEQTAGGESKDDSSTRDENTAGRAGKPMKKKETNSRSGPGGYGGGPNNTKQQRGNNDLGATRLQSFVGLNVSDRDKAVGQLKGIAAQFGGTAVVNGNSIEIVVPGDKVAACAAKVRALNPAPARESDRERRKKDPEVKQEPEPSVHLSVTVKEKE